MPGRTTLYLDVDGVLLRRVAAGPRGVTVRAADGLAEFLDWAVARFDCVWLSTRDRDGGAAGVLSAFRAVLGPVAFDTLCPLLSSIRTVPWQGRAKFVGIDFTRPFFWIDDAPDEDSLAELERRGLGDRLLLCCTDRQPGDLARLRLSLEARLPTSAAAE